MSEACPAHKDQTTGHQVQNKNAQHKNTQHENGLKLLQNRLFSGQNWTFLQKKFGIGILALVYTGSDAGFSNTE